MHLEVSLKLSNSSHASSCCVHAAHHHCCMVQCTRYTAHTYAMQKWFSKGHQSLSCFRSGSMHDGAGLACHVPHHLPCPKPVAVTHDACSYRVVFLVQARCVGSLVLCTPLSLPVLSRGLEVSLHSLILCLLLFLQLLGQLLSLIPATASECRFRFCKSRNAHVRRPMRNARFALQFALTVQK